MPRIKDSITDILAKLSTLQVVNSDGNTINLPSDIWNDQVKDEEGGKLYDGPKPSSYIETSNPANFLPIGQGFRSADLTFRIHLVHEFYNADGTFGQNLPVFDFRAAIITLLHLYVPIGCGCLVATDETQDYNHGSLYHYIIDFTTTFIDDAGSVLGNFIDSAPPYDAVFVPTLQQPM